MHFVDLSHSKRLPVQMELLSASSRMTNPGEVIDLFLAALRRVYGPRGYALLSRRGLAAGEYRIVLVMDPDGRHLVDSDDPWEGHGVPIRRGGCIAELIAEPRPRLVDQFEPRGDPVIAAAWAGYHSLMAVPIYDRGQPLNWLIVLDRAPHGCRVEELEELNLRANLAGEVINHLLTARALRAAQALIREEVTRIAAIQRALLPRDIPDIPGIRVAARHDSFDQAGGDLYDLWAATAQAGVTGVPAAATTTAATIAAPAPPPSWAVMIADASGHGPSATVIGAMLHSILRAYPGRPTSAADLLSYANRQLCQQKPGWSFVTVFLALYHPSERVLCYARAGHHPPLLRVAPGTIERLEEVGDLPLGISPDAEYHQRAIQIQPGQSLLMYTDGVCDAHNPAGETLGVGGIERAICTCDGDPHCMIDAVVSAVRKHEAGCRPGDDQTLLALQAVA